MKPSTIIIIWSVGITVFVIFIIIIVIVLINKKEDTIDLLSKDSKIDLDQIDKLDKKDKSEFERKIRLGKIHAKNHSIIFSTIIGKNEYKNSIKRMKELGNSFKNFKIIVAVEQNTNVDDLKKLECVQILEYKSECNYTNYSYTSEKRCKAISIIRNMILEYCLEKYREFDYYCVFDSELSGMFSREGFFECFSFSGWNAMACNGLLKKVANDRQFEYIYHDIENFVSKNEDFIQVNSKDFKNKIGSIMNPIKISKKIKKVNSAFGGCIIYPLKCLNNCRYSSYFFDHSSLHYSMIFNNLDKIFINPRWIVYKY